MRIEYTKKGMKITHPTGVVQVLSVEDLTRFKVEQAKRTSEMNADIARIDSHIAKATKMI